MCIYKKNNKMKRLIQILIFLTFILITSCYPKLYVSTLDHSKTKVFKCKGDIIIDEEHVHFTTIKGTKQSGPKDLYIYRIYR